MVRSRFFLVLVCVIATFLGSCSSDYKDFSTASGRQALMDKASNHLTVNNCGEAIDTLSPLYNSVYVDNDVRLLMASAYACKGGLNFLELITAVGSGSSDIWATLVKANYSASAADGKLASLKTAAEIIRLTATSGYAAVDRTAEANAYMIFVQFNLLATLISPLGVANSTNGKKTQSICAACGDSDTCAAEVAFAVIDDSLDYVSQTGAFKTLASSLSTVCSAIPGGICPTNRNLSSCGTTELLQGQQVLNAIDLQWGS